MKMDVSQNSPIVIHSDDEDDDDDDVVLVKEEEATKIEEDDVIFISEEPSTSVQNNKKNKSRGVRKSSSSSVSDDDYSCTIPQLKYFQSEFSSVNLVDDILRPLDLSQGIVQATEVLPSVITHKLTLMKPMQATCSSANASLQGESTPEKNVDEIEINPVKIVHNFDLSSGKSIDDTTFVGRSAKTERFAPLKLPEGAESLLSQTLNTPICKIDPSKECFNLCSQDCKNKTPTNNDLLDMSSTSSQICVDKISSMKENQKVPTSFGKDCIKWDNPQEKVTISTYASTTSLAQDSDINSPCDDRIQGYTSDLLTPLSTVPGGLEKSVTVILDQALGTSDDINPGNSCCTDLMPTNTYLTSSYSEVCLRPGTSKQLSNLSNPHVSQSSHGTVKLHVPKTKTSHVDGGSSLTLDFNNLNTEDLSNLFDFFSTEDDLVSPSDSGTNDKCPSELSQSLKDSNKLTELANSSCIKLSNVCSPEMTFISGQSSSISSAPLDLLTKSDPHILDSNNPHSSDIHLNARLITTECKDKSEKSSIPTLSSEQEKCLKRLHGSLSTVRRRYSASICDPKKSLSPHSRCLSSSQVTVGVTVNSSPIKYKWKNYCFAAPVRKCSVYRSRGTNINNSFRKVWFNTGLIPTSERSSRKFRKIDPPQWQVVSSESAKKKSRTSVLDEQQTEAKRQKKLEESTEEKPCLKMRLKLSAVISGPASCSETSSRSEPSNIGLKKSIIRRHASMTGDPVGKEIQPVTSIHRSASENGLKVNKQENNDNQISCVTCEKAVTSRKFSKCSKGHGVCTTCLEVQVKAIFTGDVKQKNIKCPGSSCVEFLSFDELKRALPSFVVDILEEKLDKEYLSYITKWMFTDEQLKSRSEFATSDTRMPPCPALSMRKYEEIYTQESRDPTEDLPTFWAPMERGAPVMVFEVIPDTEEYRALAFQFHETLSFGNFDIVRIIRVQNPILWKYFALKRSEMVQENDGMDVTEKQLYHGTHRSTLEAIARKGFDWRLSGKHGTIYGCGSYFAKTARYSHGYTDRSGSGISVKTGNGLGRIIQPNLALTSLGGVGFTSNASYLARIPSRLQSFLNLPQPPMIPLLPLPPMMTSQNHPPQPPPAHYHLPAPPPAHGQISSLQVPAHNQTSNPVLNKNAAAGGPSASTSNLPFVKTLSLAPVCSAMPIVPGPSVTRSTYIQQKFNCHNCLSSSKTLCSDSLCNSLDFQSAPQTPFTAIDTQFSSASLSTTQTSFQIQSSNAGIRNSYANPSTSVSKLGHLLHSSMSAFTVVDKLGSSNSQAQAKHVAVSSSSSSTGTKGQSENKPTISSISTKLRAHERGTADLTKAFARDTSSETHFMFVARVLVGRHTGGKAGLKRPPPLDENNPFGKSYDSCVDDIFCPQVFVIFDSNQAYPEYVIEYNWHKE